ncbi:MAG: Ig-like domain-containing protein [Minisyncoccia bacterium]
MDELRLKKYLSLGSLSLITLGIFILGIPPVFAQVVPPVLVTGISVSGASSVTVGGTLQMSASVSPSNATNPTVSWSIASGGTGRATISLSGLLTTSAPGTVTVVATANDYSGVTGSEQITINPTSILTTSITVSGTSSVTVGGTLQMSASVSPSNATNPTVAWSIVPGGTGAATISPSGLLGANTVGTVTVVATANDGTGVTAFESVTINPPSLLVTNISVSGASSVTVGVTAQMSASVSPSTATNQTVAWSIAPGGSGAASIGSGGLLAASLPGTVTVVATANDGTGVTGSEQVTINLPTYTYSTPTYTLTYTAGAHGSISGTSPQTVDQSASGTAVTAVPDVGYQFVAWNDGSAENPRIDTDVQGNVNVAANFSLIATSTPPNAGKAALQAEIAQLQAQLIILLQQLLAMLQSQAAH